MTELTENQLAAMEIYAAWKDARGDFESEDPNELAEIASAGINTVIHLGGLVEALQQQLAAAREELASLDEEWFLCCHPAWPDPLPCYDGCDEAFDILKRHPHPDAWLLRTLKGGRVEYRGEALATLQRDRQP